MNITERPTTVKPAIRPTSPIHSSTVVSANEYYSNANYVSRHRTLGSVSQEKKGNRETLYERARSETARCGQKTVRPPMPERDKRHEGGVGLGPPYHAFIIVI